MMKRFLAPCAAVALSMGCTTAPKGFVSFGKGELERDWEAACLGPKDGKFTARLATTGSPTVTLVGTWKDGGFAAEAVGLSGDHDGSLVFAPSGEVYGNLAHEQGMATLLRQMGPGGMRRLTCGLPLKPGGSGSYQRGEGSQLSSHVPLGVFGSMGEATWTGTLQGGHLEPRTLEITWSLWPFGPSLEQSGQSQEQAMKQTKRRAFLRFEEFH